MGFNLAFKGLKYVINSKVRFVGYLYIIDLINSPKIEHITKVSFYIHVTVHRDRFLSK